MKKFLKLLLSPVSLLLAVLIKIGAVITSISAIFLNIAAGLFVLVGVWCITQGNYLNTAICFVIAFLASPYGIPMFVIRILGFLQRIRYTILG